MTVTNIDRSAADTVGTSQTSLPSLVAKLSEIRWRAVLLPATVLVVILSAWQYVAGNELVSRLILASPVEIARAYYNSGGEILANAGVTLGQAIIGYMLGNTAGFILAVIFVHSSVARRSIYPIAAGAEAIPFVAILPVFILWLGNGMEPKILIITINTLFPMVVNAMRGLRTADREVNEMMFTLSASERQKFIIVRLPASIPFVFNALKLSACGAVVSSLVAEWLASDRGLGFLIIDYGQSYQVAELWAAALFATFMSLCIYGLVVLAERQSMPWLSARKSKLDG